MSVPKPATHVTSRFENTQNLAMTGKIYISPTLQKNSNVKISKASLTEVMMFTDSFEEFNGTIRRFLGDNLPIVIIDQTDLMATPSCLKSLLKNSRFLHGKTDKFHILVKISRDDPTAENARTRLFRNM